MRRIGIFALFIVCMHSAIANDYHVSVAGNDNTGDGSAGNPWRSLRVAVTKVPAGAGHTIKLSAGTFVESSSFNVPAGVSIEGAGVDQTIIKAASGFYYNPGDPGFALDKFLMTLNSSASSDGNQTLRNFAIDGDGKRLHGGIYIKNRNRVVIENVKVRDTNFCGVWLWDMKNSTVRKLTLSNCSWGSTGWASGALQLANLESVELTELNIDESTGYGIKALGSGGNRITKMKVHDSRISVNPAGKWNNGSAPNIAFELWEVYLTDCEVYNTYMDNHLSLVNVQTPPTGGRSIRVHHNVFDLLERAGGHGYAIELSINDAEIDHNWIKGGSYGIAHWSPAHCANWSIHHNTFNSLSSGYPGDIIRAQVSGLHNVKFYNNTVEMTGTATIHVIGLHAGNSDNLDLRNNLIINSNTSYNWFPNQLIFLEKGASLSGLSVINNLLDKLPIGSVPGTYSNNILESCKITQSGARPSPYYLPGSGSPLIDAGTDVGFPYLGSAPDIGAHEIGAAAAPTNQSPTVVLKAPADNASFSLGASIKITAEASDKDGTVSKVEFFNGTTKLGEDTSSPFEFEWKNAAEGSYALSAKATDNAGSSAVSPQVNIKVVKSNAAPSIAITSPAKDSKFKESSTISISAQASDSDGTVSKVEFFKGADKLGEDTSNPYTFEWKNVPAGNYTLTAKATDNAGGVSTSAPIAIAVGANELPVVKIVAPSNNATVNKGSSVTISVDASDSDGTISKIEFYNGQKKLGEDIASPYAFTWNADVTGEHELSAKAIDNDGGSSISSPVTVTVNEPEAEKEEIVISIASPTEGGKFAVGEQITIVAEISPLTENIVVQFFAGSTKLGEDTSVPFSYVWNADKQGSHTVSVKTVVEGVIKSDEVTISVIDKPLAHAGEDITTSLPAGPIQLTGHGEASDGSAVTYNWQKISGPEELSFSDPNSETPMVSGLVEGIYIVELTVTDANGLVGKDQVEIRISDSASEVISTAIPRYFTPNDDGINDKWEWPEIERYSNSPLTIFNRAGQKIFEADSYNNSWDGTVGGQPLQADAYYYVIHLKDQGDIKGAVRIIR